MRELGDTVDLHGGGRDLVFPHHECETAQSESVTGATFSRHWLHVGMVGLDGTKMSKSIGNLVFVGDLLKDWDPMAVRLALLGHHYRLDWEWDAADLDTAAARLERWRAAGGGRTAGPAARESAALEAVRRCLDDDLNACQALAVLDDEAAAGRAVGPGAALLGVEL
jgi:L-cysteine:1D-myo-inositol 2-amino-2-deoxy-alpha-D-glucopyranoside ligase